MDRTTVRVRGGAVYYVQEAPMMDEPTLRTFWWRIPARPEQVKDGGIAISDGGPYLRVERSEAGAGITLERFIDAPLPGNAQADFIELAAIPAPRVRKGTEIRYRDGRWERYSKREGWIPA